MKEALEKIVSDAKESYKHSAEQNREILEFFKSNIHFINQSNSRINEVINHLIIFNNKPLLNADQEAERIKNELNKFKEEFIRDSEQSIQSSISKIPTDIVLDAKLNPQDIASVNKLNERLKISKYSVYMFVAGVVMMIISGLFMYFSFKSSSKSVQQIRTEYVQELKEQDIIFIRKEENDLSKDIFEWMNKNPNTKVKFEKWRKEKNGGFSFP